MTPEIKSKLEEFGKSFEEFKTAHAKELAEIKANGQASAETAKLVNDINERVQKNSEALEAAKAAMNRSRQAKEDEDNFNENAEAYKKDFVKFLRKGDNVSLDSMKKAYKDAFSVNVDEDGGFLVTPNQSSEIIKKIYETSPMREICSVQTISSDSLEILEDLEELEGGWVGETEDRGDTENAKLKQVKIFAHEIYAKPKATQKFLDDAAINVEAWLNEKLAAKFGRIENTAFVSGDGSKKPKGILAYASGDGFDMIQRVESATQNVIAGDDLIELLYSLKSDYLQGSLFALNRNTEKVLRKLKGSDGHYIWQPGLNGPSSNTILGYGIKHFADLFAYDSATAANNGGKEQIIFGNFKAGYQIVDRIGIRVLRDPYSSKPFVEFYSTKRVGGGVKNFEALKVLKVKA